MDTRFDVPGHGPLRGLELGDNGPLRQRLTALVADGTKTATAGRLADYAAEGEELEQVGERLALLDDDDRPMGTVVVTAVEVVPLTEVPWSFAEAEGEGFTDIEDWRARHRRFWLRTEGATVPDDEPIVLVWLRYEP
ncbi:ASCH domain-containing protein [Curtobacterium sp. 9128]|uniref:ASCH domain-containing protein n=1 Tax=Curtobacterium sp. 9128 TaxID=1793722 RepID=UPI00119D6681|nr:ASCH domain-containing protein [Curtobacterium sp. 9128]